MASYEKRSRNTFVKRASVDRAHLASIQEKKYEKEVSDDTKTRMEIQTTIRKLCYSVKTRSKILEILNEQYSDCKYEKYQKYFEGWVNDMLKKMEYKESEQEER